MKDFQDLTSEADYRRMINDQAIHIESLKVKADLVPKLEDALYQLLELVRLQGPRGLRENTIVKQAERTLRGE